jgi:transglutaminase-like putative cysteine protease
MRLKIVHASVYEFGSEVFLEPHQLRFKPKNTPNLNVESYSLQISPTPEGISESTDIENNFFHFCWFEGMHHKLSVHSELVVNTKAYNPFDFIIYPNEYFRFPFEYSGKLKALLYPSLLAEQIDHALKDYGQSVLRASTSATVDFLIALTKQIHEDFTVHIREEGSPLEPDETFSLRRGSCRDLTWMQIQLLRQMGMAARFVSGYFYPAAEEPQFELHAWVEVYIPGAGWIGFDPSHGIMAGNAHITIASSAHYENAMTIAGTIRGSATSKLHTELAIDKI